MFRMWLCLLSHLFSTFVYKWNMHETKTEYRYFELKLNYCCWKSFKLYLKCQSTLKYKSTSSAVGIWNVRTLKWLERIVKIDFFSANNIEISSVKHSYRLPLQKKRFTQAFDWGKKRNVTYAWIGAFSSSSILITWWK